MKKARDLIQKELEFSEKERKELDTLNTMLHRLMKVCEEDPDILSAEALHKCFSQQENPEPFEQAKVKLLAILGEVRKEALKSKTWMEASVAAYTNALSLLDSSE